MKPKDEPRKGWEKAFKKMHKNGDLLLMDDVFDDEIGASNQYDIIVIHLDRNTIF